MKNFSRASTAGLILFFSLGAFAAPAGTRVDGRRTLKLTEATEVLGSTVPPGSYELRWARERGSDNVRLEVTHGGAIWATGQGVWTSSDQPYPYEALVYRNGAGGNALAEIRFRDSADLIRVDTKGAVATSESNTP